MSYVHHAVSLIQACSVRHQLQQEPPLNMTQAFYMEMDFLSSFSGLRILPSTFSDWFGCGINSEGKPILRPKLKASMALLGHFQDDMLLSPLENDDFEGSYEVNMEKAFFPFLSKV